MVFLTVACMIRSGGPPRYWKRAMYRRLAWVRVHGVKNIPNLACTKPIRPPTPPVTVAINIIIVVQFNSIQLDFNVHIESKLL